MWGEIGEVIVWVVLAWLLGLLVGWALATALANTRKRGLRARLEDRNRELAALRGELDALRRQGSPAEGTATAGLASSITSDSPQLAFDDLEAPGDPAGVEAHDPVPAEPAFFDVPATRDEPVGETAIGLFDEDDDLEAIHGVGPKLATLLRANGIRTFRQIAAWTDPEIDSFSEKLPDFPDRIREEAWVESAREQHERKYGA